MKSFLSIFLLTTFLSSMTSAQTVTGPGLGNDQPPSAAVDRQEDTLGEPTTLNREDSSAYEMNQKKKVNPLNEKGPHGKEAQEEAKTHKLNMNKKEMKQKQKGY